jgi:iron complex outermembrane receptor protein
VRRGPFAVTVGVAKLLDKYFVEHVSYQRDPYRSGVRVAEPGRNADMSIAWRF